LNRDFPHFTLEGEMLVVNLYHEMCSVIPKSEMFRIVTDCTHPRAIVRTEKVVDRLIGSLKEFYIICEFCMAIKQNQTHHTSIAGIPVWNVHAQSGFPKKIPLVGI
jgi:hypothetical protein